MHFRIPVSRILASKRPIHSQGKLVRPLLLRGIARGRHETAQGPSSRSYFGRDLAQHVLFTRWRDTKARQGEETLASGVAFVGPDEGVVVEERGLIPTVECDAATREEFILRPDHTAAVEASGPDRRRRGRSRHQLRGLF